MKDNYVISIGRQFGSGGRALGRILSEKLGVPFYDKELLLQAARESGLNIELFEQSDERMPNFFGSAVSCAFGMNAMPWYGTATSISEDNLYRAQSDLIEQLAQRGPCIIVGRTSDYILRHHPGLLSVFLHADMDDCVARILQRHESESAEKAQRLAERTNKLRANFYNFYTDKRWGHAASYDLTFSSSKLSLDQIADIIISTL